MSDPLLDTATIEQTEEERHYAGQRYINKIWEFTQAFIAVAITIASLIVSAHLAVWGTVDAQTASFVFIYGVANLVIGFYFGRTNHSRPGRIISEK